MNKQKVIKILTKIVISFSSLIAFNALALKAIEQEQINLNSSNNNNNNYYFLQNNNYSNNLPKQAQDWLEFVKKNNQELNCPESQSVKTCVFMSSVQLDENNGEYQISINGNSFINGFVEVPTLTKSENNSQIWFKKLTINGKDSEILKNNNKLFVSVEKKDFELKIFLNKKSSAELSNINFSNTPLILINNIKTKDFIKEEQTIKIYQKEKIKNLNLKSENQELNLNLENLQVNVFRKIKTQIPTILSTKIKIVYSGPSKDLFLGKIIPENFQFNTAQSSLRIEKKEDGFWTKIIPGEHEINIESFLLKDINVIKTNGLVEQTKNEIWSLEQINNIKQVDASATQQVDPKQALVPREWNMYPAYLVKEQFNYKTVRKGLSENKNLKINLSRNSYYGFTQENMIHIDKMSIENSGIQFLTNINNTITNEKFSINGNNQTLLKINDKSGVIIPKGKFNAENQSFTNSNSIPIQTWEGTTQLNNWDIYLAPRYRMFAALGDSIKTTNTWLDNWGLYTVFSIFLILLAFYKLFGKTIAILAFISFLIFPNNLFSWGLWLTIFFTLGMLKVLPENSQSVLSKYIKNFGSLSLFLFSLYIIDFIRVETQLMINPSLEILISQLRILNPYNFVNNIIVLFLIFMTFDLFYNRKTVEIDTKSKKYSMLKIIGFTFISIPIIFYLVGNINLNKNNNLGGINNSTNQNYNDSTQSQKNFSIPQSASFESSSHRNKIESFSDKEIETNIILKTAQVGSGKPSWDNNLKVNSYNIKSIDTLNKNTTITFYIAPIWLVNILTIFQILFLLLSIFLFGIGLIHLSNKKDWFNNIPLIIRENKFVKVLLINDLKRGF